MTDDDLAALERNAAGVPWGAELVAEVRRLRAAVAWYEKELAAEREVAGVFEELEDKLLADRGIRREPKSTPAVTLAAEVDRLRAAVAAERAWAAGVADAEAARLQGWVDAAIDPADKVRLFDSVITATGIAAAIRRGPEPTEGV